MAEAEELDLLGEGVRGHEVDHVRHPPQETRAPTGDGVAPPAVTGVGDESWDRGDQGGQRQQGADADEQHDHRAERQHGLEQTEGGRDHQHRTVDGVVLGAPQEVVRRRVLVEGQVEGRRLLHHHQLDPHRDRVLQQLLSDVAQGVEQGADCEDQQLDNDEEHDHPEGGVRGSRQPADVEVGERDAVGQVLLVMADAHHDRIGQQERDADRDRRYQARESRRCEQADRRARAGVPDQAQDLRQGGGGPEHRLLEALPAAAEVLRALWRLRRLEGRVAGQAAVGGATVRLPAAAPASPPDHWPVASGRTHCHVTVSLRNAANAPPAPPAPPSRRGED